MYNRLQDANSNMILVHGTSSILHCSSYRLVLLGFFVAGMCVLGLWASVPRGQIKVLGWATHDLEAFESSVHDDITTLFCWLVMQTTGYEVDLVREQANQTRGIFDCNGYSVYSLNGVVSLGNGLQTTPLQTNKSAWTDAWGSWLNRDVFLHAWFQLIAEGNFRNSKWTVKVDPDTVLFPDRLQWRLRNFDPQTLTYVNNQGENGLILGAIEICSVTAVQSLGNQRDKCMQSNAAYMTAEDQFISACFHTLGFLPKYDPDVLDIRGFGPGWDPCAHGCAAAFHPRKKVGQQEVCVKAAAKEKCHNA